MSERQASNFRKSTFTDKHVSVMAALNRAGIAFKGEVEFIRPNEFSPSGKQLFYVADILLTDPRYWQAIIEIEGKGSASRFNERRDAFFKNLGIEVYHFDNKEIDEVAPFIQVKLRRPA